MANKVKYNLGFNSAIIDGKIDEILPIPREKGKPSNVVTQSIEKIFVERAVVLFERFLAKGPVRS